MASFANVFARFFTPDPLGAILTIALDDSTQRPFIDPILVATVRDKVTIGELKQIWSEAKSIPLEAIQVTRFEGRICADSDTLKDLRVKTNDHIYFQLFDDWEERIPRAKKKGGTRRRRSKKH
jgi:hypothetical protein